MLMSIGIFFFKTINRFIIDLLMEGSGDEKNLKG